MRSKGVEYPKVYPNKRAPPKRGFWVLATKARIDVRTGVAHGEATKAEDPPNKNVLNSDPCSFLRRSSIVVEEEASVNICPVPSNKIGCGLFPSFIKDDDDDDDAVNGFILSRKKSNDGNGTLINSKSCNPMRKQMLLEKSAIQFSAAPSPFALPVLPKTPPN